MSRTGVAWMLAAALAIIAYMAARAGGTNRPPPDIVFVNSSEVITLDPQRMSYIQDFRMAYALYEGLVRWNNEDFTIEPAAADLPNVSEDGLTYTFTIREGSRWSNGDPVTAHDFVYSFKRLLWPETTADYSNILFVIEGAEEFFRWRTAQLAAYPARVADMNAEERTEAAMKAWIDAEAHFAGTVGLRAADDRVVEIRLKQPVPYFLDLLCFAPCHPIHQPCVEGWPGVATLNTGTVNESAARMPPAATGHGAKALGRDDASRFERCRWARLDASSGRLEQKHQWARPGLLVSNGPYVLTEWRYKRDIRLDRNPMYRDQSLLRNESVMGISIPDDGTASLALGTGAVDWLTEFNADYLPDMIARKDPIVHPCPAYSPDFWSFNCRSTLADGRANPLANAGVRRALVLAIDREVITRSVTRLHEPAMTTIIPPHSIPGYESPQGLGFDAERAREELAAAGWRDSTGDGVPDDASGATFPTIELLFSTHDPRYKWIALELAAQWQRALGIPLETRGVDRRFFRESLRQGKFMIAHGRWYGDYGDPTTFLNIFKTGDGNNDRGYSNPEFDAMLAEADAAPPHERMQKLAECEAFLFNEDCPMLVICQLLHTMMFDPEEITGLTTHPRMVQYLWKLEKRRRKQNRRGFRTNQECVHGGDHHGGRSLRDQHRRDACATES